MLLDLHVKSYKLFFERYLNKEEDMMKEAKPFVIDYVYAQSVECEEPCEGRLSRTVL